MGLIDIEQCDAQYGTVGGDQRQKYPQNPVQKRAGFANHHLGELHHHRDHQNKADRSQISEIKGTSR